jgi:hypothetical protein
MTNHEKNYTPANVAAVYENIRERKEQRKTCSYRIQLDGKTIVKRTYNLNEFYSYRHSLTPETKKISITIYGRFMPVESFELVREEVAPRRSGYSPNEELAFENIRLFAEVLDKDVEIFELRERLARAEAKKDSNRFNSVAGVEVIDMGNAVMLVVPKAKFIEGLRAFETQLNISREMLDEVRAAITPKK